MCQTSYVVQGRFLPGRHTLFFLLQAPLVLLEKQLTGTVPISCGCASCREGSLKNTLSPGTLCAGARLAPKTLLGRALRSCCTFGVLMLLAEFLFWPPLESCAADVNGIAELSDGLAAAAARGAGWVVQA